MSRRCACSRELEVLRTRPILDDPRNKCQRQGLIMRKLDGPFCKLVLRQFLFEPGYSFGSRIEPGMILEAGKPDEYPVCSICRHAVADYLDSVRRGPSYSATNLLKAQP